MSSSAIETPASVPQSSARPTSVWEPLPPDRWDEAAARHLLRRTGWSAQPAEVARALHEGLPATLARLFPTHAESFPTPRLISRLQEDTPEFQHRIQQADAEGKRLLRKEARDRSQQAWQDFTIKWLQRAADPAYASTEKWVLFLSNVYVVSFEKVHQAAQIHEHFATLRGHAFGSGPSLTKAVSRSPAMIRYLDLDASKRDAPNENFARELFELFLLGEGNYTEHDIKEAARAFTGYRQRFGQFFFAANQHDSSAKTIFGKTGAFAGDEVIDLAYSQPAASRHLPDLMARFYLTDQALPKSDLEDLGIWWAARRFDLRALLHRFFGSTLFYDPSYQGNYIKSPFQLYLGLVQDLRLDVAPFARALIGSLRQMGQTPFTPPNVRGWVGGRTWINSATLNARRQLVQALFSPFNEANLNADDQVELVAARTEGRDHFTVDNDRLKAYAALTPEQVAHQFLQTFLPGLPSSAYAEDLRRFLSEGPPAQHLDRVRNAAITLLQSPEYQLC